MILIKEQWQKKNTLKFICDKMNAYANINVEERIGRTKNECQASMSECGSNVVPV